MVLPRRPWFVAGVLAGLAWAVILTMFGMKWVAMANASLGSRGADLVGLAAVAAGQFVFLVLVADRCFPRVSRRVRGAIEAASLAVLFASLAAAGAIVLLGTRLT